MYCVDLCIEAGRWTNDEYVAEVPSVTLEEMTAWSQGLFQASPNEGMG